MINTPIHEPIPGGAPKAFADELIGHPRYRKVEQAVVGRRYRAAYIHLPGPSCRRRGNEPRRLIQQMIRVQDRHIRPGLPR